METRGLQLLKDLHMKRIEFIFLLIPSMPCVDLYLSSDGCCIIIAYLEQFFLIFHLAINFLSNLIDKIILIETADHKYLKSYPDGHISIDNTPTMFSIQKSGTLEAMTWHVFSKYIIINLRDGRRSAVIDYEWAEEFRIVFLQQFQVAFISSKGRYLSAHKSGKLTANATVIGNLQVFKIHVT